ncbi:hypothetical protein DENIS_4273 [Desulfonema ishimotonii]|uniref:site-specific DNA-methyltransferase (adenine-specific) n=1 Tax=Desulfonema ishimotonii TaxID=45657 RepID=A0A401G225_9BACT|nr:DNA methyltransferase [Desulfonema ishimotonii]GBC63279.1 hypothetical protein DENIS_4273 [Desulfonema ishimotonii]
MQNLFTDSFFRKQKDQLRAELGVDDAALTACRDIIRKRIEYVDNFDPKADSEERDWPGFEKDVFRDLLGYALKDDSPSVYNVFRQKRVRKAGRGGGTGKADCTLGFYSRKKKAGDDDLVVVEFKAPNTRKLDEASDQLWDYLERDRARWGIVTNFNEISLYNVAKRRLKKQTFYLVVPDGLKDKKASLLDENELIKFLAILRKDRLLAPDGISETEKMLARQGVDEQQVEKEFYRKYYQLRIDLFNEIAAHNPDYAKAEKREERVTVTQKLLDRLIFIWFCEDSREELLPRDILQRLIADVMNREFRSDGDVWQAVRELFRAVDAGGGFDIPSGYNGELFKPDPRIDHLVIPNRIFEEKIKPIGEAYDFGHENELSVNILGHIFEQSISDLENLKGGTPISAKKTGRRKRDGVYYTPEYITRYIVEQALGGWLADRRKALGEAALPELTDEVVKKIPGWSKRKTATLRKPKLLKKTLTELGKAIGDDAILNKLSALKKEYRDEAELREVLAMFPEMAAWADVIVRAAMPEDRAIGMWQAHLEFWTDYQAVLREVRVLDPACGSGAFLIQAFDYLYAEGQRVNRRLAELGEDENQMGLFDLDRQILEHNLYGVDINAESVEITKLSLWLKTASRHKKLNNLFNNIRCGNSLIDDPAVAGEKAFKWEAAFPGIMENGGFDVIVGNPPYVRQESLTQYKPYFSENYKCYTSTTDLYAYFYEKGLSLLCSESFFSYISNNFFKTTGAGIQLRNYLKNNSRFISVTDFADLQIFEGVTTYPIIIVLKKSEDRCESFNYLRVRFENLVRLESSINKEAVQVEQPSLKEEGWIFEPKAFEELKKKIRKNPTVKTLFGKCYYGIKAGLNEAFIISEEKRQAFISQNPREAEMLKPFLEGKDLNKWLCSDAKKWLILFPKGWTSNISGQKGSENAWKYIKENFPGIAGHLGQYESKAVKRHDKGEFWWELRACAYYDLFESPKIVWPNLQEDNKFAFDNNKFYINAPSVILPVKNKALLCIVNSKLAWFFLKDICAIRSGGYVEMKPQYFEQLPIVLPDDDFPFIQKADIMLNLSAQLAFQKLTLSDYLTASLGIPKLTRKLRSPETLSFDEFIREVKKKKIRTENADIFEAAKGYFEAIAALRTRIDETDREIDQMVYRLYGLTDGEIHIVETACPK